MPKKRLLIVEDDKKKIRRTREYLEHEGVHMDVHEAHTLEEAIDAIRRSSFHVALVDINLHNMVEPNMPGMPPPNQDGAIVVQTIKSLGEGTRCIVVSGQGSPRFVRDCFVEFGADDYFQKGEASETELAQWIGMHASRAKLDLFNGHGSFTPSIAGNVGNDSSIWLGNCLSSFQCVNGAKGMEDFLSSLLTPFAPLLAPVRMFKTLNEPTVDKYNVRFYIPRGNRRPIDAGPAEAIGHFWSRSHGTAIKVAFGGKNHFPADKYPNALHTATKAGMSGAVTLDETDIDVFYPEHSPR
ncbi:MAG: response regulator [Alphaproteobacteria bacterium]|nr:response regulator [Alphaproteobacteria bacterium]